MNKNYIKKNYFKKSLIKIINEEFLLFIKKIKSNKINFIIINLKLSIIIILKLIMYLILKIIMFIFFIIYLNEKRIKNKKNIKFLSNSYLKNILMYFIKIINE
ncbi:hypothetical protein A355_030 [Candidatus Carsonella ruddii HT isolate Thao2000]|uniref:Uncharacterized protein n=1 Tax=Candidatus Carsonella ruddii HT isolate Thao2000 TaxID=1202539 RepID=J3VQ63_CARRU|nr:hypothetical protein [Candidatus Carsonella ruddii]AFP84076.1 hypothetical protein A355_030 [Candidatus Carsonella ruddii HT isolate Thao2000]